mgnify:CR=1 FL=1
MAIHVPGYRPKNSRINQVNRSRRNVVAVLSLTAMVDMFTVLTVFLLQNYNPETGAVLELPPEVTLPKAAKAKELKPAHVVVITQKEVQFEKQVIATLDQIKGSEELLIVSLHDRLKNAIELKRVEHTQGIGSKLQKALDAAKSRDSIDPESYRKMTIQADKSVDFEIIKKVMHTANEAGANEINFAILQKDSDSTRK